jgi:predicted neutral ceramidase superfamily lipid hydrolase
LVPTTLTAMMLLLLMMRLLAKLLILGRITTLLAWWTLLPLVLLLSTIAALLITLLVALPVVDVRHIDSTALEIDVYSSFVGFGVILETEFATDLFDSWFDLLDVPWGVVAFADDDVKMILAVGGGVFYAFFEDVFGFFDELTVEVNCILDFVRGWLGNCNLRV